MDADNLTFRDLSCSMAGFSFQNYSDANFSDTFVFVGFNCLDIKKMDSGDYNVFFNRFYSVGSKNGFLECFYKVDARFSERLNFCAKQTVQGLVRQALQKVGAIIDKLKGFQTPAAPNWQDIFENLNFFS